MASTAVRGVHVVYEAIGKHTIAKNICRLKKSVARESMTVVRPVW